MGNTRTVLAPARPQSEARQPGRLVKRVRLSGTTLLLRWMFLLIVGVLPVDAYLALPGKSSGVFLSQVLTVELLGILAITSVVAWRGRRPLPLHLHWRDAVPLGLVLLASLASVPGAHSHSTALKECAKVAIYLGIYVVACALRPYAATRRYTLVALSASLGIVLMVGLVGRLHGVPDIAGEVLDIHRQAAGVPGSLVPRSESTFRYPNELATYLLLTLPLMVACLVKAPSALLRLVFGLLAGLGTWLLLLTYTRGALLAFLLVVPLVLILAGGRKFALAGLSVAVVALGVVVLKGGSISARLLTVLSSSNDGYSTRFAAWHWAFASFARSPIVGVGAGNMPFQPGDPYTSNALGLREVDAENLMLNVLAERGILGLAVVCGCFAGALRSAWAGLRSEGSWLDSSWNIAILGSIVAVLCYGMADPVLVSGENVGLLCALIGLAGARSARSSGSFGSSDSSGSSRMQSGERTATERISNDQQDWATVPMTPARGVGAQRRLADSAGRISLERRTVFFVNASGFGGAEQHSLNLAEELQRRGGRVLVIAPPNSLIIPRLIAHEIPYRALPVGMSAGRWRGFLGTAALLNPVALARFFGVMRSLACEEPSTFLCPFLREQLLATMASRRLGAPVVWVLHSPLNYLPHRYLLRPLWLRLARKTHAVVAVSRRFAEQMVAQGLPADRIVAIANAVRVAPVVAPVVAPAVAPAAANAPIALTSLDEQQADAPLLIGACARLVTRKGMHHLIAAMPAVLERHPSAQLVIAGTGRAERALRQQVFELGLRDSVYFLGYLSRPARFLSSIGIFVHPTIDPGEVFPTVILEAAAAGRPVIASAIAGIPDQIVDGVTGLLTPPGESDALARAILTLLDDPVRAEVMGQAACQYVAEHYSLAAMGERFWTLLTALSAYAAVDVSHAATDGRQRVPASAMADAAASTQAVAPAGASASATPHEQPVLLAGGLRARLASSTAWLLLSKVATAGALALWTILAARTLAPATYGALMLCAGIADLATIFTDAGMTSVATRELAKVTGYAERQLAGALLYLKLLSGLVTVGALIGVAFLFPFDHLTRGLLLLLAPSMLFVSLKSLSLLYQAKGHLQPIAVVSLLLAVVNIGASLGVAHFGPSVQRFVEVRLAVVALSGGILLLMALRRFRPVALPPLRIIGRLAGVSLTFGLALVLNAFYYRIDVPLLAWLAGDTQVAMYTSAYRVLDVAGLLPISAAGMALPMMAAIGREHAPRLREFAQQYLELAVACGLLLAVGLLVYGNEILGLLYGSAYASAGPVLQVLAWVGAATLLTNVFSPLVIALDRRRAMLLATAFGLLVNVALNIVLIPRYGALAAAWTTLLTEGVMIVALATIAVTTLRWRIQLRSLCASAFATLLALGVHALPTASALPEIVSGTLALAVWPVAYLAIDARPLSVILRLYQTRAHRHVGATGDDTGLLAASSAGMALQTAGSHRLRVVEIVGNSEGGGTQIVTALIASLDPRHFDVTLIAPASARLAALCAGTGAAYFPLPLLSGRTNSAVQHNLDALLDTLRPAVVHAHGTRAAWYARRSLRGHPERGALLYSEHLFSFHARQGIAALPWYVLEWLICRDAAALTLTCRANARLASRWFGVGPEKILLEHYGIDQAAFQGQAAHPVSRAALHIPEDAPLVGTVGRLIDQKGIRYLVDAAAQVLPTRPDTIFLVVGDGVLRAELEAQCQRLGVASNFRFVGAQRQPWRLLANCDLIALPSLYEGLPLTVLEALCVGLPVVATPVGGTPEVIREEQTGLLVPPRNAKALAHALARVLNDGDLRASMRQQSAAAVRPYDLQSTLLAFANIYRQMAPRAIGGASGVLPPSIAQPARAHTPERVLTRAATGR